MDVWIDIASQTERMANKTSDQPEQYTLHLGARGSLVLPASLRERLGLTEGDRLMLTVEADGILRMVSLRDQVRKLQGFFKDIAASKCLDISTQR